MNNQSSQRIVYDCASNIKHKNNERIHERVQSRPLQTYLEARPVSSKYSHFPIIEPRKISKVPMIKQPEYHPERIEYKGSTKAPWVGYASNVNHESELRNQFYKLQKNSSDIYVPNSQSDLYSYVTTNNSIIDEVNKNMIFNPNSHPLLFKTETFSCFDPKPNINLNNSLSHNNDVFMKSTRADIKNM